MKTPSDRIKAIERNTNALMIKALSLKLELSKGEFREEDHPRADDGRFGDKTGSHEGKKEDKEDGARSIGKPTHNGPGPVSPEDGDIISNESKWKGQNVPIIVESPLKGDKIVVWEMENGHLHGFGTDQTDWRNDDNTPSEWRGYDLKDQGDYAASVKDFEKTTIVDVREYDMSGASYREGIKRGDFTNSGIGEDELDSMSDDEIEEIIRDHGIDLP